MVSHRIDPDNAAGARRLREILQQVPLIGPNIAEGGKIGRMADDVVIPQLGNDRGAERPARYCSEAISPLAHRRPAFQ